MLNIIIAVILTSAFFILFFEPKLRVVLKNKTEQENIVVVQPPSTTKGFIEDTRDAFIIPVYPSRVMDRDITGESVPIYGDIGSFVAYSGVSEYDWLHGFPHEKSE